MKDLKQKILVFLMVAMFIALAIFIGYIGVLNILHDDFFDKLIGLLILACALFMPITILIKNEKLKTILTIGIGSIIIVVLGLFVLLPAIGLFLLPFYVEDLSVDLGIIILKSSFVKFIIYCIDVLVIYFLLNRFRKWFIKIKKKG